MTDLLVIGGGAAGLMAAGAACARGLTVTVLEHNPKGPGQKLLITGKGRCNVTSDSDVREFLPYVRHNGRFLYSSLYAFPPSAAMELFESLGVPLKTERGRRVFPRSDRAADVLAALRDYARDAEFVRGSAKKLVIEDGVCKGAVTDRGETLRAENTLIATGGITDARGIVAAFALGAEGVQMGTRMVSAAESPVHQNWKDAIIGAKETDTVFLNRQGPGPALRALRTEKTSRPRTTSTRSVTDPSSVNFKALEIKLSAI